MDLNLSMKAWIIYRFLLMTSIGSSIALLIDFEYLFTWLHCFLIVYAADFLYETSRHQLCLHYLGASMFTFTSFFMHCMYNVKMHWWVILHAHQAVRWTGKKVKCTSCELLYTEIVKLYTSIKRVYKKNGGVQPWGYRILPSFLLGLLDLTLW